MPFVVKDRVKVTSTTTGTGTFTLGAAATGFQSFASIAVGSGWNIAVASFFSSFSVSSQEAAPIGLFFKPDGLKMYVSGNTGDDINEYNLSSAWNVSSASYVQNFSVAGQDTAPRNIYFKPDGLKMYVIGSVGNNVIEYNLSSAWNISTASFLQESSGFGFDPYGLFFRSDGTKMYTTGSAADSVYEYNLSTAWDVSTISFVQSFSVATQENDPVSVFFNTDGTKMYVLGDTGNAVYQYNLGTGWNISTATYQQNFSVAAQETIPTALFFKPDGEALYVVGQNGDAVYQYLMPVNNTYYAISNGTDWEVGIGTLSSDGSELFRNTVLESSNSNALVNWGAGSKDVFCTFPSDATEGTVPTADNSSVGTDLYAWTNLKKQLDAGVINGVPYANGNMSGVVSTYSLVYTLAQLSYSGGVLAPNGDIHFVPYAAARGQKINSLTGVVSTYSLIVTNTNGAYFGGVLAPNGDIHFVPYTGTAGQKINASGVVSTYSLVRTGGGNDYAGGVLAPNGDVHFVPSGVAVGQKVSAAGVVSTYSLVYTAASAYRGGVLAPNGDIHFVPHSANRGQKISAAGVVSTYSLVYTRATSYSGGVVASNGDIHFVPYSANRGQKISVTGIVSTYSLAYTSSLGAYQGAVLAPNGDIHFVPYNGIVGQKISSTGAVSTYSLVDATVYSGGVLAPNGDIHFVPTTQQGQKISTNTTRPIGYALSPFFNKF
jgi:streptogramin lyase/6-phosphogluconolactonase (cycloisomerase 2 family)